MRSYICYKNDFLFSCKLKSPFSQERFYTQPHFESESFWNLEMAHSISQTENLHHLVLIGVVLNII